MAISGEAVFQGLDAGTQRGDEVLLGTELRRLCGKVGFLGREARLELLKRATMAVGPCW